jgi:hypothetical protein
MAGAMGERRAQSRPRRTATRRDACARSSDDDDDEASDSPPPAAGADLRAALVASCLRGALPPVDLRAVCGAARRSAWCGGSVLTARRPSPDDDEEWDDDEEEATHLLGAGHDCWVVVVVKQAGAVRRARCVAGAARVHRQIDAISARATDHSARRGRGGDGGGEIGGNARRNARQRVTGGMWHR